MSLKTFHLVFIALASILAFGCGMWGLANYSSAAGRWPDLAFALGSAAAGVALLLYGRYVLRKLKNVSNL